jgi:hypothetical protein
MALKLGENEIGEAGCIDLAEALGTCSSMTDLDLGLYMRKLLARQVVSMLVPDAAGLCFLSFFHQDATRSTMRRVQPCQH